MTRHVVGRITWNLNPIPRVGDGAVGADERKRWPDVPRRRTDGTRITVIFGSPGYAAQQGSRDDEPHGREWLKQVTGSGREQAVKVVGNDEGGT
jgi:hypothetical protein